MINEIKGSPLVDEQARTWANRMQELFKSFKHEAGERTKAWEHLRQEFENAFWEIPITFLRIRQMK